jgi:ABC-type polar amino acid transport system ATPase subunit
MSRCGPQVLDNFVAPEALAAYDRLWAPDAAVVLCVQGWSGSGKSTLLCYLDERHDSGRVRVLLDPMPRT